MATLQFGGIAANMFETDFGWAQFGEAIAAVASLRVTRGTINAGQIQLIVDQPPGGIFTVSGRFNFSSEEAALASIVFSVAYANGVGGSLTIGGLNQSFNALVSSLDTLGTTASNDTITGYNLGDVLVGDRGNDRLFGGGGGDALFGDAGNDALDGQFAGRDLLVGGTGNDTYTIGINAAANGQAIDQVVERVAEGTDQVLSYVSFTLGDNVERLTLLGIENLNATGNALGNALVGNAGANTLDGQGGIDAMSGGAGNDTYIVDVAGDTVTESIAGAAGGIDLVQSGASFVLAANVEALTLTGVGDINGTGNTLANTLIGNAGNNRLDGMGGADTMTGGDGDDTYVIDNVGDVVDESVLSGGGGIDTVVVGRSVNLLTDFPDIENVTLSGTGAFSLTGTTEDNVLIGNTGANTLTGGNGNDVLDGKAGADSLVGGDGDDAFYVDAAGDQVIETAAVGSGNDTVYSSIGFSLIGRNVENLVLLGTAAINATGNDGANALTGNGGANRIDGGVGADSMTGGAGNDTYVIDDAADKVVELLNQGTDTVLTSIGLTLADHVEILTLTTTAAAQLIGNGIANTITGNNGDDTVDGGAGNDTLKGGLGDDTYRVDSTLDVVTELLNHGNDVVEASASFVLGLHLEALTLTGVGDINATGNTLANTLIGNAGNNRLDGGVGADTMTGGDGDDTYVIDNLNDVVDESVESGGAGTDTIVIGRTVNLADFTDIENATLSGTGAFSLTGTTGDNVLIGNTGANTITGGDGNDVLDGKAGADSMVGGDGDDAFYVDAAGDHVIETDAVGSGNDTVYSSIGFSLVGRNVENLVLLGTAAINATGNDGANALTGNSAANRLDGGLGADTMTGGAGNDTFVIDDAGDEVVELLNQGIDTVLTSIGLTLADHVEILTLTTSAAANLIGNAIANTIIGNNGDDTLDGGAGNDTLKGGLGNDTYRVDSTLDVVTELLNQGNDLVESSASFVLGLNLEALTLTGVGNINATGNTLANTLTGNTGNNRLDGGAGADTMTGGDGDDTYVIDNLNDVVDESVESGGAGTDTIVIGRTVNLADFPDIENATLSGAGAFSLTGTNGDNVLTGNTGANTLNGGLGNDVLDGKAGADSLVGGDGDDAFYVDAAGDQIVETADVGSGNDTVYSSIGFSLVGRNVENLTLIGVAIVNATGNDGANSLTGNTAANRLDGGLGADTMTGGAGNDTYVVDLVGDAVVEQLGEGTDTVLTGIGFTLADHIENLTLTTAPAALLTGNGIANTITGNNGDDTLDGGAGNDTLKGGLGNDTYLVDSTLDVVTELASQGTDHVRASASFVLGANVEILTLIGTADINATGNALANTLTGNIGNNRLDGMGGADTMTGGDGDDTYVVDNINDVLDESVEGGGGGIDTLVINRSVNLLTDFAGIENATLSGTGAFSLTGTTEDNVLIGNAGANTLTGGNGNDVLDGKAGADSMDGGDGDDTYYIDSARDVIIDVQGANVVFTSIDIDLTALSSDAIVEVGLIGTSDLIVAGSVRSDVITGNTGANLLLGLDGNDTLAGAGGEDLLLGGIGDDDLDGGDGNDEVIGDNGNDLLAGGDGNDVLSGGRGNDTLFGGAGIDTLVGGAGNDVYLDIEALDIVTETADGGFDTVQATGSIALGESVFSIEAVELLGTGNTSAIGTSGDNSLIGNVGDNVLDGAGGNDTLAGDDGDDTLIGGDGNDSLSGGIGADDLAGGSGNDTYAWGGDPGDVVTELVDEGVDTILTAGTLTLADFANVENAGLTGSAIADLTGNAGANRLAGNTADNLLSGLAGNDTLLGDAGNDLIDGGANADSMDGGLGDDTFIVDDEDDVVTDILGGLDVVRTFVDFTLTGGVEEAEAQGDDDVVLTGTVENNRLTGNEGDNVLDGGGGFDTLVGGQGNDTYLRFQQGVLTIVENADEGIDTVSVIGDVSLTGPLAHIENAVVDPSASTFNVIFLTGNTAANRLEGGAGANALDGGTGADTLIGGDGNDTYTIDNIGDVVTELANQGNDLLILNRSVDMRTDFANVERFQLSGSADLTMTGNDGDNALVGSDGANRIDGGAGADFMAGENGNDTYVVDNVGDEVSEGGNGIDLVEASISYTMVGSVENLLLTGADNLNGSGNLLSNVITGNSGNNVLDGGGSDDTLVGGEGNDTLIGGQGTDRLVGDGGNDELRFDFSELYLDGGSGIDLMRVTGTGQPIRLSDAGAPGDAHRYQNIEIIDLTGSGNNAIDDLTWQQVLDLSDDDRLIVDGDAGDSVVSETGQDWVQGTDQTIGANLYNTWTSNGATLVIDADVTFTPL